MSVFVWISIGLGVFTLVSILTGLVLGRYVASRPRFAPLPERRP